MDEHWTISEFIENLRRCSLLQLKILHYKNRCADGEEKKANIMQFIQEGRKGDEMKQIIPGLWLGRSEDFVNIRNLKNNNISYILDFSVRMISDFGQLNHHSQQHLGDFKYLQMELVI